MTTTTTTTLNAIKRLIDKARKAEAGLRRNGGKSALADASELYELVRTLNAAAKLTSHIEVTARIDAGQGDHLEDYL